MVSFSSTHNRHIPVMLMETIDNLKIKDNGIYIDGTLGLGGHSEAILQKIDKGLLIGIDRDKDSISFAKKRLLPNENFKFFNDSYKNLKEANEFGWKSVFIISDGIEEEGVSNESMDMMTSVISEINEEQIREKLPELLGLN